MRNNILKQNLDVRDTHCRKSQLQKRYQFPSSEQGHILPEGPGTQSQFRIQMAILFSSLKQTTLNSCSWYGNSATSCNIVKILQVLLGVLYHTLVIGRGRDRGCFWVQLSNLFQEPKGPHQTKVEIVFVASLFLREIHKCWLFPLNFIQFWILVI